MKKLLVLLFIAAITSYGPTAFAVPQQINYQGYLTRTDGSPLDTTVAMTFKIYFDSLGGTLLWTESHPVVSVEGGIFNVHLGELTPLTDAVFWSGQSWLGITVGTNTEMTPRSRMVSVAYSYRVGTVDGASGGMIAGDVQITGRARIGYNNDFSGSYAFVAGVADTASGLNSCVGGGHANKASGDWSNVGGGEGNRAIHSHSTVAGGMQNTASGWGSSISGGSSNTASQSYCSVGGGIGNSAIGLMSEIGGGSHNRARGEFAVVAGGGGPAAYDSNSASGNCSFIGGGLQNRADGDSSVVCGGRGNIASAHASAIGGGIGNTSNANAYGSTVGGGRENTAGGGSATVGGGYSNTATGEGGTVAGGSNNIAGGWGISTIGGGGDNSITSGGGAGTVAGGGFNSVSNMYGTVGGGQNNSVNGQHGTVPGGRENHADGNYSFAAGYRSQPNGTGEFAWADATGDTFAPGIANTFNARASGGFRFWTTPQTDDNIGARLPANQSAWVALCDSTKKNRYGQVDTKDILGKVSQIPIENWSYKNDPGGIRHVGPMAQDFWNAFHLGEDSLGISTLDPDGIALAAIQELAKQNAELRTAVRGYRNELSELRSQIQSLLAKDGQTQLREEK